MVLSSLRRFALNWGFSALGIFADTQYSVFAVATLARMGSMGIEKSQFCVAVLASLQRAHAVQQQPTNDSSEKRQHKS